MKYDAQKVQEIARRLGVSEKTVMQYLRCRAALQGQEIRGTDAVSFEEPSEAPTPQAPAAPRAPEMPPGHLLG